MTTNDIDYNIDYEPNYNLFLDDSAFEENETEEEKENIRTALYQKDLLAVFNMSEFDEDVINKKIRELFLLIQENEDLFLCMNNISKKSIFSNEEIRLDIQNCVIRSRDDWDSNRLISMHNQRAGSTLFSDQDRSPFIPAP